LRLNKNSLQGISGKKSWKDIKQGKKSWTRKCRNISHNNFSIFCLTIRFAPSFKSSKVANLIYFATSDDPWRQKRMIDSVCFLIRQNIRISLNENFHKFRQNSRSRSLFQHHYGENFCLLVSEFRPSVGDDLFRAVLVPIGPVKWSLARQSSRNFRWLLLTVKTLASELLSRSHAYYFGSRWINDVNVDKMSGKIKKQMEITNKNFITSQNVASHRAIF